MKKILFSIQVISLLLILPLVFILEMNHVPVKSPSENTVKAINKYQLDVTVSSLPNATAPGN